MMFAIESDYYFAERMYYNNKNKKMIFPVNGFTVDYDGPTRNFYAWHFYAPDAKTRLEFGDYEKNIQQGDKGRLSFVYDKGRLIEGLLNEARKNGVDVFTGVNVTGIEKTATGVQITGNDELFEGTFAIGADGLNSRIAQLMGFNKERTFYGAPSSRTYHVTGLNLPHPEIAISANCFLPGAPRSTSFFLVPRPFDDEYMLGINTPQEFDYITKQSAFSNWFADMKVKEVLGYVFSLHSPVTEPYKDNVLLVGDATWFAEAEITGSMMCGWRAANAIAVALRDNRPDREGIINYIEWWKKSYPEFDDFRNFMLIILFNILFSEEERTYIYNLFKSPLRATLNPFLVVRLVKQALEPLLPRIKQEMPAVVEKIMMLEVDIAEKILLDFVKKILQESP
jgi:flavin-dependent dehydrogenase